MLILGISCFYHDAAAAIIEDGLVLSAAQEERFTRIKHDEQFPEHAIRYCLEQAGIELHQLDAIVFYEKPLLKFERIIETFTQVAPKGWRSFIYAMPKWINEKLFFKSLIKKHLRQIGELDFKKTSLLFTEHHMSHAASAFYPSNFEDSAILIVDGVGEWATISISKGNGRQIELLQEIHFPHSIGMLYSAFTYYLGFKVNSGEYKLMGLSPYGNKSSENTTKFKMLIYEHLILSHGKDGFQLNLAYFTFQHSLKMLDANKWEKLFGLKIRKEGDPIEQSHCDLALAIQEVTEELMLELSKIAQELTSSKNLCLAGGVALNCVSNGKILHSGIFDTIFVPSSPGDSGGAVGAALFAYHHYFEKKIQSKVAIQNQSAYLGPRSKTENIQKLHRKYGAVSTEYTFDQTITRVANYLSKGKVVGWVQDRMEFGPRALGNRSILAMPSIDHMQSKLNLKIKFREDFRPFAPVLKAESAQKYFQLPQNSNYMEWVVELNNDLKLELPNNFSELSLHDKLNTPRSEFQAVIHTDYTARPQTVSSASNPKLHQLLSEIEKVSGHPILVNTSFNVRGEPIVCTPEDAYACFMQTDMDILVIENYIYIKEEQPESFIKLFKSRNFSKD